MLSLRLILFDSNALWPNVTVHEAPDALIPHSSAQGNIPPQQPLQILIAAESAVFHKSLIGQLTRQQTPLLLKTCSLGEMLRRSGGFGCFFPLSSALFTATHGVCVAPTACSARHSASSLMQPKGYGPLGCVVAGLDAQDFSSCTEPTCLKKKKNFTSFDNAVDLKPLQHPAGSSACITSGPSQPGERAAAVQKYSQQSQCSCYPSGCCFTS